MTGHRKTTRILSRSGDGLRICAQCPSSEMVKDVYGSVTIDICRQCGGVWLDDGELQALVAEYGVGFQLDDATLERAQRFLEAVSGDGGEMPVAEADRAQAIFCPICDNVCFPTIYSFDSGVVINRCVEGHGLFFDPIELEAILVLTARERKGLRLGDPSLPVVTRSVAVRNSGGERSPRMACAPALEESYEARVSPRLASARPFARPLPIDVKVTVSRGGSLFFEAVRSPQGRWYSVKQGGTLPLPGESGEERRYWVELENGGALVLRDAGRCYEWVLVGMAESAPSVTGRWGR